MGPYTILVIVFRHNKDSFQVYQLLSYGMSCVAVVTVYTSAPLRFTEYSHQWNCLCAWVAMTLSCIKGWDYVPVDNCCIIDGVYRDEREQLSRLVCFFFIHSSFIFTLHPFLFSFCFCVPNYVPQLIFYTCNFQPNSLCPMKVITGHLANTSGVTVEGQWRISCAWMNTSAANKGEAEVACCVCRLDYLN